MPYIRLQTNNQVARRQVIGVTEYLIVPVTAAVVPGVMNGIFYSAEEMAASLSAWNGVPVPLGEHPHDGAMHISAYQPEIIATNPAMFWNPKIEGDKFRGEVWIDVAKANALGGDAREAVERIERGEKIEVSTGLYCDTRDEPGVWGGTAYTETAYNIGPDHLAILLRETGACSVADGCGVFNSKQEDDMPKTITVNLEFSLTEQENRVYDAWYQLKYPDYGVDVSMERALEGRIIRVLSDRIDVVRQDGLFAYDYTMDENGGVEFGEPRQYTLNSIAANSDRNLFQSIVTSLIQTFRSNREVDMSEKIIKGLLANKRCKLTEEMLKALDSKALLALNESLIEPEEPDAGTDNQPATSEVPTTPPATQPAAAPPADDTPAWAKKLIEQQEAQNKRIEELAGQLTANADRERGPVVEWIVANCDGLYETDDLKEKSQAELDKIRALVEKANPWKTVVNYEGLGMPQVNGSKEEPAKPKSLRVHYAEKNGANGGAK